MLLFLWCELKVVALLVFGDFNFDDVGEVRPFLGFRCLPFESNVISEILVDTLPLNIVYCLWFWLMSFTWCELIWYDFSEIFICHWLVSVKLLIIFLLTCLPFEVNTTRINWVVLLQFFIIFWSKLIFTIYAGAYDMIIGLLRSFSSCCRVSNMFLFSGSAFVLIRSVLISCICGWFWNFWIPFFFFFLAYLAG